MERIHVAVTGLNSSQNPSPGIGIIYSLREAPGARIYVTALAYDRFSDGLQAMNFADQILELPFPEQQPDEFLRRIAALHAADPLGCLMPTIDAEIPLLAAMRTELVKIGIGLLLPKEESLRMASKEHLAGWTPARSFRIPPSAVVHSRGEALHAERSLGFPLVLKGPLGEAFCAASSQEAAVYFDLLTRTWGTPVILQRAVQGEEYAVAALANRKSQAVGVVAMKKIIQDDGGTTWAGVTVQEDALRRIAQDLITRLKWVGPLEMEFIKEANGAFSLIEINNRFPAWISLATRAGQNLPLACLHLAMEREVLPFTGYASGLLYVRVADDRVTDLRSLAGLLTRGEWRRNEKKKRDLRKTRDHQEFSQGGQQVCRPKLRRRRFPGD